MHKLDQYFHPRAVAVIGASDDGTKIGGRLLRTLLSHPFQGGIYPVNPNRDVISGLKTYRYVRELPGNVDLALIAIPAAAVPACVQECANAGISAVLIFSSGFSEGGAEGIRLQQQLVDIAARTGIRIAGPNAEGFYSAHNELAATFSPAVSIQKSERANVAGKIDILSQSGGLGFSFFKKGHGAGLSFGKVVTVGNQVDLELAEYLEYLIEQGDTRLVMMYVESFKHPQRFREVAERAGDMGKPIVMVKVGSSQAGQRAAESHTGALASAAHVVDAVLARHGVLRVDDQDRLIDISAALLHQPLPGGNRVAVITTSGGTAVWLADACEAAGLTVPEIDAERQARIAAFIPSYGSAANPVDITAQARNGLALSLEVLRDSDDIDSFIVAANFSSSHRLKEEGEHLARAIKEAGKPALLYSYAEPCEESLEILESLGLYCHTSLQGCVAAVKSLWEYRTYQDARACGELLSRVGGEVPAPAVEILNRSGTVLCEYEAKALLSCFGMAVPSEALATTAHEAVEHAQRLGYPVVLKLQSPDISHKTDAQAIKLGLRTDEAVGHAYLEVLKNGRNYAPDAHVHGVLVQKMAPPGVEMIAGIVNDRDFGPMVMAGMGGVYVEVLQDVAMAPAPLSDSGAQNLLRKLKGYKLLEGARGGPRKDIEALMEFLVKLSKMAVALDGSIAEFDVNPIFVHDAGEGLTVVDALGVRANSPVDGVPDSKKEVGAMVIGDEA